MLTSAAMRVEIADSIAHFKGAEWNSLNANDYPFLRHEFLLAAERSGSVNAASGWSPRHIGLYDTRNRLCAAMPLYEKTHSWGEFVFDWSWAQAYGQAGLSYYPKLVSAIPFTPAPSPRLLATNADQQKELVRAALEYANENGNSSLHVLFPLEKELAALQDEGLKVRKDCQFHWHNNKYKSFDDFLATFNATKRKKAKRDRRRVAEQGIRFRWLRGHEIDRATWSDIYQLISLTFLQRGSLPYFNEEFFVEVSATLPNNIVVILAEKNRMAVAAAVFYASQHALYGRYWGSDSHYDALHFETCYYQGIDYCIAQQIHLFEPGTQGEHKLSRGFRPVATWSAHWLARPEFFAAVGNYLEAEKRHVDQYIESAGTHSPYRAGPEDDPAEPHS